MEHFVNIISEFQEYYNTLPEFNTTFDPKTQALLSQIDRLYETHQTGSVYQLRARITQLICEECDIHLFRHSPFFFEISAGRPRYSWGGLDSPVGTYLHHKNADQWLDPYSKDLASDREAGFLFSWNNPVGIDHFCLGYDTILSEGFHGIIARAEAALSHTTDAEKRTFLTAAIDSSRALLHLAKRFAAHARMLAEAASDPAEQLHYTKIAEAAEQVPAKPPRSLYEALCSIVFCRECIGSLEGLGISIYGQLDRLLIPYYDADLAAGCTTTEEVKLLFCTLLLYTDTRFDSKNGFHETSTTLVLGGCDQKGKIVYNDLTKLMLDAVQEVRCINTKINCRISTAHPREYLERLAEIQADNIAVLAIQNDDVLIPAFVKYGHAPEDARLYVGGGCHELVLANTAVSTRADTWISIPRILLAALDHAARTLSEPTEAIASKEPSANAIQNTTSSEHSANFQDFYRLFLTELQNYIIKIENRKNQYEKLWSVYAPLPLTSATITGCIESGRDLTAGGAKYSTTALSLAGTATFIDSLYSIKHLVYDTKQLTLTELNNILKDNFAGKEPLRQYILHKLPKYGTNQDELNSFAAKVLADISKLLFGRKNGRGGDYLPAFYPHDKFRELGLLCGATPDGRLANTYLSRGCSPSEFIESKSPLDIIGSLEAIDFSDYPESFCTELTLPRMTQESGKAVLTAIIEAFLENKGSTLQFNLLDHSMLLEAQKHPEQHADIHVRVCGYSALFVHLEKEFQDEIISREIR